MTSLDAPFGSFGEKRLTEVQAAFVGAPYYFVDEHNNLVPMDTVAITGRGWGKSTAALARIYQFATMYPGSEIGVFRQTSKSLKPLKKEAEISFMAQDPDCTYNIQDGLFRLGNGSSIVFDALADMALYRNHQGASYQMVFLDEVQQWPHPTLPDKLLSNLRGGRSDQPCVMMYGGNAGDAGHFWMVDRWLAKRRPKISLFKAANGRPSILFQGNWEDNVDPVTKKNNNGDNYPETLEASTDDPLLLKMWLSGDVNIVGGRYFSDVLSMHTFVDWYSADHWWGHEDNWRRYLCMDHGTARPTVFLGMAEALQNTRAPDGQLYTKGDLVAVWEVSNATKKDLRKSDGSTVAEVSDRVKQACKEWGWPRWGVGDDAILSNDGHPSTIAQLYAESGVELQGAAKGRRVPGWDAMRQRLKRCKQDGAREHPGYYINEQACPHLAFSIRNITPDERNFSDVDTDSFDDALDAARYGVVGKPEAPATVTTLRR